MMLTNPKYPDLKIINIDNDQFNRKSHKHLKHISKILQNKDRYQYKDANICNLSKMESLVYLHRPDKIIHFASQTHVDKSINDPYRYVKSNVLGTMNMLIASSKYYNSILTDQEKKEFRFHHISTDQVFGDFPIQSSQKFTESSKYYPSSPYSATKAGADMLVYAWNRSYNLPISISNCSNNYGKYQDNSKLIPKVINSCLQEKTIPVHGSGQYIRDWLHVEQHCRGILYILQNLQKTNNQVFLFGGNCQISNISIINTICDFFDKMKPRIGNKSYRDLIQYVQNRPGQDLRYAVDITKSKNILNWMPTKNIYNQIQILIKESLGE